MGLPTLSSLRRRASFGFRSKLSPLTRLNETPPLAPVEGDERALRNDSAGCLARAMCSTEVQETEDDDEEGKVSGRLSSMFFPLLL
jgi:hypothetical protein